MSRTRGPGVAHEQRRGELLDAVLAITAEKGVAAVTLSAVAGRAGVSPGRVQHYFPTREDMLTAAFEQVNARSTARIAAALGGDTASAPARDTLSVVLTELIPHDDVTRAHLQFRQSFTSLALHHGAIAEGLRERYHDLHHRQLADLVRRDQAAGAIDPDEDPVAVSTRLAALAEGLAYYVLIGVTEAATARSQLLDAVAALYR